jgi:hypothetical protein
MPGKARKLFHGLTFVLDPGFDDDLVNNDPLQMSIRGRQISNREIGQILQLNGAKVVKRISPKATHFFRMNTDTHKVGKSRIFQKAVEADLRIVDMTWLNMNIKRKELTSKGGKALLEASTMGATNFAQGRTSKKAAEAKAEPQTTTILPRKRSHPSSSSSNASSSSSSSSSNVSANATPSSSKPAAAMKIQPKSKVVFVPPPAKKKKVASSAKSRLMDSLW